MLDECGVGGRADGHALLEQAEEQLAAGAGCAAVESERELVEVEVQMSVADSPLGPKVGFINLDSPREPVASRSKGYASDYEQGGHTDHAVRRRSNHA